MKTLYLTDLDGTLLQMDARISAYSIDVLNEFLKEGGLISFATARSLVTSKIVTNGVLWQHPAVCYNGSFIFDQSGKILAGNFFTRQQVQYVRSALCDLRVTPIVYAFVNGVERFSYIESSLNYAMQYLLDRRVGDPRARVVQTLDELYEGEVFYFACMGELEQMRPVHEYFEGNPEYHNIYQNDLYSHTQWCEILHPHSTKRHAALRLKEMMGCERLVAFGDGTNDLTFFSAADECYAMENAVPELKQIATGVIDSNQKDGMAKWLKRNVL